MVGSYCKPVAPPTGNLPSNLFRGSSLGTRCPGGSCLQNRSTVEAGASGRCVPGLEPRNEGLLLSQQIHQLRQNQIAIHTAE
jgi:hypothetical protein